MKSYKLHLRYIYTFYSFNEVLSEDIFDEFVEVPSTPARFKLHDQEDGSFIISELRTNHLGNYVVVTFPGKDTLIVREGEDAELRYDEYYDAMGDDNHNVYVGAFTLTAYDE